MVIPNCYTCGAARVCFPSRVLETSCRDTSSGEGMSATTTRPDSSYLLRKLHSLSGLIPVGAFLAEHFWSNSAALVSPEKYNAVSQELQTIPFRPFIELFAIILPILFHGGYGVFIWVGGKAQVARYSWWRKWLYTSPPYTCMIRFTYYRSQSSFNISFAR